MILSEVIPAVVVPVMLFVKSKTLGNISFGYCNKQGVVLMD